MRTNSCLIFLGNVSILNQPLNVQKTSKCPCLEGSTLIRSNYDIDYLSEKIFVMQLQCRTAVICLNEICYRAGRPDTNKLRDSAEKRE